MVTLSKYGNQSNRNVCEIVGLSSDEKPISIIEGIGISNGSTFLEMDTGKVFIYDEEKHRWHEL